MVSTASRVGTGNIAGVSTAVCIGGPGAVFWMWIIGVFGIATKYSETYISVRYRVKDHKGTMLGGAMYAWRRHFTKNGKTPWWALVGGALFAILAAIASFGIGAAVQSGSAAKIIAQGLPFLNYTACTWVVGILIVILISLVLFGGIKAIAKVCEVLVPVMAIFYVLGCIIIICINGAYFIPAIQTIVVGAFNPQAILGGGLGFTLQQALQFGAARGLFSNESGLGSAPLVAAAATTRNPARQALVSMTGTFWDTVIICAITGITLTSTLLAGGGPSGIQAQYLAGNFVSNGAALTTAAFDSIAPGGVPIGAVILIIGMATFSISTILGWAYYGNRCVSYLFGKHAVVPYYIIYVIVALLGAIGVGDLVWNISDITNALMSLPNILAVLLISNLIARETKHYVYDHNLMEKFTEEIPVVDTK
jgi:AGCS family alanine or glycine:cation symporter